MENEKIDAAGMAEQNPDAVKEPDKQEPDWKALSRKHENRERENWEALQKANSQLAERDAAIAERDAQIARMNLRLENPDLFDEDTLGQCKATTPEGIKEWGEGITRIAEKLKAQYAPAEPNPPQNKVTESQDTPDDLSAFASPSPVPSPKPKGPSPQDLYEKARNSRTIKHK